MRTSLKRLQQQSAASSSCNSGRSKAYYVRISFPIYIAADANTTIAASAAATIGVASTS